MENAWKVLKYSHCLKPRTLFAFDFMNIKKKGLPRLNLKDNLELFLYFPNELQMMILKTRI